MARLDLNAVTDGYRTSPRERITAHLADDLRRRTTTDDQLEQLADY